MKAIQGFEGLYSVTRNGLVYSYRSERFLKTSENANYKIVTLCGKGTRLVQYVHRLVALAYIPNPKNLPEVNHIDGNPYNNDVGNLEWATYSGNLKHAYSTGLRIPSRKYDDDLCHKICRMVMDGWKHRDIEESLGLEKHVVKTILTRPNYKHVVEEYDIKNSPANSRKISVEKVISICKMIEEGVPGKIISEKTGVTKSTISGIKNRKLYASITSDFKL